MAHYLENDPGIWKVGCLLATCPTDHGIVFLMFVFLQVLGGGSAPQGGGFIVHPTIGLGKAISSTLFFMTELGYMHFINGDISSISLGISINMNMWHLKERI